MNPSDVIATLVPKSFSPARESATAYAPSNIALAKYWGKRNSTLNLPLTDSLSISLFNKGTTTTVSQSSTQSDYFTLNAQLIDKNTLFYKRLSEFLNLFRPNPHFYFSIQTNNSIPHAAGLASSASGFAALILALNTFFDWHLEDHALSILARLGSGSASRSLWHGFVHWHAGKREDGLDCFAEKLNDTWPELRVGLLIFTEKEKAIPSRDAMKICQETSAFYPLWPSHVEHSVEKLLEAIKTKNFTLLGNTAEQNALAMHATMLTSNPPFLYWQTETLIHIQKIWELRKAGLPLYFTEDAGPNLKLLFPENITEAVRQAFGEVEVITPFKS